MSKKKSIKKKIDQLCMGLIFHCSSHFINYIEKHGDRHGAGWPEPGNYEYEEWQKRTGKDKPE